MSVLKGGLDTLKKTKRLILEVAEGNEEACLKIIRDSGFELASVDQRKKEDGVLTTSNWLVLRRETTIHSTTLKDETGFLKVQKIDNQSRDEEGFDYLLNILEFGRA